MSKHELSEAEKALFRSTVGDVKPLAKQIAKVDYKNSSQRMQKISPRKELSSPSAQPAFYLSDYYPESCSAETLLTYAQKSFPRKRFRELKQGHLRWEAKIDLHGLNTEKAKAAIIHFVFEHYQLGHRCILIIHGKGKLSPDEPILKNLVNCWLPQFPYVLAFHSALAKDGGRGAVYVLLQRQRGLQF